MTPTSKSVVTTVFLALILDLLGELLVTAPANTWIAFTHTPPALPQAHSMVSPCRSSFSHYIPLSTLASLPCLEVKAAFVLCFDPIHRRQTGRRNTVDVGCRCRRGSEELGSCAAGRSHGQPVQLVSMYHQPVARSLYVTPAAVEDWANEIGVSVR